VLQACIRRLELGLLARLEAGRSIHIIAERMMSWFRRVRDIRVRTSRHSNHDRQPWLGIYPRCGWNEHPGGLHDIMQVSERDLGISIEEAAAVFGLTLKRGRVSTSRRPLPYCRVGCPAAATSATADIRVSTPTVGQLGSTSSLGFPKDICWV
jgi:hypothetical protein